MYLSFVERQHNRARWHSFQLSNPDLIMRRANSPSSLFLASNVAESKTLKERIDPAHTLIGCGKASRIIRTKNILLLYCKRLCSSRQSTLDPQLQMVLESHLPRFESTEPGKRHPVFAVSQHPSLATSAQTVLRTARLPPLHFLPSRLRPLSTAAGSLCPSFPRHW